MEIVASPDRKGKFSLSIRQLSHLVENNQEIPFEGSREGREASAALRRQLFPSSLQEIVERLTHPIGET